MKITGAVLLFALALSCSYLDAAGQDAKRFCREYMKLPQLCTMDYNPICGTDGKTYSNKCAFCNAVLERRGWLRAAYYGKCRGPGTEG